MNFTKINKYATSFSSLKEITEKLEKEQSNKIAMEFINWNSGGYLGQPVVNDGEMFSKNLKKFGYSCYYICNTTATEAKKIIELFISRTGKDVVFFYSGHGTYMTDYDGDEDDEKDEAFVFKSFRTSFLKDDDFATIVNKYMTCNKLIAITDSCHSGTVWDIDSIDEDKREKITCISSCLDNQVSLQLCKNGLFTTMFWQCFDEKTQVVNIKQLNNYLSKHDQTITFHGKDNKICF